MFIVEGPDLVGKTTLAKKIAGWLNELGWPHIYRHLSRLPETWHWDPVSNYGRLMNPYVVQDRFHYSEPLYSRVRGDSALLGPSSYAQVERRLRSFAAFTMVITADEALIEKRYTAERRVHEMYSLEKVLEVNRLYEEGASSGDAGWSGYRMPCDLWIRCTEEQPFVELSEHLNLHIYLNRLTRDFPYAGAKRVA